VTRRRSVMSDTITMELFRRPQESWGIRVVGEYPCVIQDVQPKSPADDVGVQMFDRIFSVNGVTVFDKDHDFVAEQIKRSESIMRLTVYSECLDNPGRQETSWNQSANDRDFDEPLSASASSSGLSANGTKSEEDDEKEEQEDEEEDDDDDDDDDDFDHTDYQKYCDLLDELSLSNDVSHSGSGDVATTSEFDMRPNYEDAAENRSGNGAKKDVEQKKFIITRQDQKKFDEQFQSQSLFRGSNAAVAGAFTGDHNVIRGVNNDVRGVRKRVKAGIQHFNYADNQEKIRSCDRGKLIIYTTSLGVFRAISSDCNEVRKLLGSYRVKFEDRDIYKEPEHKIELYERLNMKDGQPLPPIPRVYIDGIYVGGFSELNSMSECGDLRIRLKDFPKYNIRSSCPTCESSGIVTCHSCQGKTYRSKTRFSQLKCGTCRQKGVLNCPDCLG